MVLPRLRQEDGDNHKRRKPFASKPYKPGRVPNMVNDQARKCRLEGGTNAYCGAEHTLSEIEAAGALCHVSNDQRCHCPNYCRSNAVQQLDSY